MAAWPKLEPSYFNPFNQEYGSYSNKCFSDVFLDRQGRLWLNVCGLDLVVNSMSLFQFDGYRFTHVELFDAKGNLFSRPILLGGDWNGQLYGMARGKEFFLADPNTRQVRAIPFADSTLTDLAIRGVTEFGGDIFVLGYTPAKQSIHLFVLKEDILVAEHSFDNSAGHWRVGDYPLVVDQEECWFIGGALPLYRLDRKNKSIRAYGVQDLNSPYPVKVPTEKSRTNQQPALLRSENGTLYLFLPEYYGSLLFQFDREKDQFIDINEQFPANWRPENIFQDEVGNICFLFRDQAGHYRALLMDSGGRWFDYTKVVAGQSNIFRIAGKDFRQQVFLVGNTGLYSVGMQRVGAIRQALAGKWVSSMAPLPDGRLLVNTVNEGWFVYDKTTGISNSFSGPDCGLVRSPFGKGMKQQIIPDDEGHFWFISHNHLVHYQPQTNDCLAYNLGREATLFGFINKDLVVVQFNEMEIAFFDVKTQQLVPTGEAIPQNLGGFIRDIFVDSNGILWVPTNKGLWRIDLDLRQSKLLGLEDGFADIRFTSIYEDSEGRLWLGTYFGGLHIYHPQNGSVEIIDQRQGLSHNAVMCIIPDDEEDIWVGTEYGINIISKKGEVLNSVYKEDGLAYDIFERFDPLKTNDGLLFFGSRQGISIVNPLQLKTAFKNEEDVNIYLTELAYHNKKEGKEIIQNSALEQLGTIQIPAENPSIRLKYGLSSYLEPQKNRYAYLLEGKDKDWHYLGAQSELNISQLPTGKYRLLIKGADFRNNWTEEPIAINIHAHEFFYKQVWFYILCCLPFLIIGLIWARSKQLEARRLEMEVARRTQKIQEDKELIEHQTQELRQLDDLKSRFFTNISHELRTPVTLIIAPLENLLQKFGSSLDERFGRSLRMILRNASKLGKLVEELLELSKLEVKKAELKEISTPLGHFCRYLFSAFQSAADLKNIHYTFHAELEEETCFLLDRNRLEKIINNLLSNALKFTPKGGAVVMRVRSETVKSEGEALASDHPTPLTLHPSLLIIEVKDTGRGIPQEDLPYIFDRYFQSKQKNIATEGGMGIGLALSWELARLMQGELTVESQWEEGTTFLLRLPAREDQALNASISGLSGNGDKKVSEGLDAFKGTNHITIQPRILIVEDNQDMQELLHTLLSDKYDCLIAQNGAEAWNWLEKNNEVVKDVKLILSDVMMPEMDGYSLLERIKGHERWQKIPVIMLTARAAEGDKLQALRMGVDDYLLKPFSPMELEARVKNLIANYQTRERLVAKAQDLSGGALVEFESAGSVDLSWLKEVESAAKEALDKEIKLTAAYLATQIFLSERQFSRKLKTITGLTPNGYIQEIKLQKARHLLENKVYSTTAEVARTSGYSSSSYLAKIYQQRFGKMPGDYL